jgi:hypothetical protein
MQSISIRYVTETLLCFLLGILSLALLADLDAHVQAYAVYKRFRKHGNQEPYNRVRPVWRASRLISNVVNSRTGIGVSRWDHERRFPDGCHLCRHI